MINTPVNHTYPMDIRGISALSYYKRRQLASRIGSRIEKERNTKMGQT